MNSEPLACLKRVAGVLDSFVCGPHEQLLLTDMPEGHELDALERSAARLMNLLQTASETLPDCHSIRLRFAETELVSLRLRYGLLCVLTTSTPDRELLGVTTQMVARRLSAASG